MTTVCQDEIRSRSIHKKGIEVERISISDRCEFVNFVGIFLQKRESAFVFVFIYENIVYSGELRVIFTEKK